MEKIGAGRCVRGACGGVKYLLRLGAVVLGLEACGMCERLESGLMVGVFESC